MALGRDYNGTGNAFYNEQVEKRSRERGTIEWRDDFNPHGAIPSSHLDRFFSTCAILIDGSA